MALIKSYLLTNVESSLQHDLQIKKLNNFPTGIKLRFLVLKTFIDNKPIYCCLAGGKMINGEPHLTPLGEATLAALCNIPSSNKKVLIFQEVKLGQTPLKIKVKKWLKKVPRNGVICFVGDMTKELDGVLLPILNLKGVISE